MTRSFLQRPALVLGAVFAVVGTLPATADAQKALVYCPVNVDATGCNAIVTALTGPAFPLGVHRGYDGTGGTVDLKAVDLFSYSVFVVPSLADNASSQPYAKLRETEVVEHLRAALIGRIAMWSGTPDQGATNRAMKDALIQNLAGWASGAYGTARGPGLVALLDASASPGARYDWVRAVTPLPVASDPNLLVYSEARALNPRGTSILTSGAGPITYANLATFGFQAPNGAAGVSLDAVGQTGSSQGGQVILLTAEAGNTSAAIVRTDKDDYAPGETVTITGSGWQAGEAVKLTLHMDPLRDSDTELMATADASGNFTNTDFSPQQYDIGVRFVLTAVGQVSGRRAQTTFTDATKIKDIDVSPASRTIAPGGSTTYTVTVNFNGNGTCTAALTVTTALPSGVAASFSPNTVTGTATESKTSTLSITTGLASPAGTTTFTIRAQGTGGGSGTNDCGSADFATVTATLTITAAPNVAPVLDPIGNKSVNEGVSLGFTATASDANAGQTLTFSLDAGAPAGAAITSGGVFSWTPTEAQGPGSFPVTIRVTDNGTPAMNDFETITITVNEVNLPPVLGTIGPKSVNELAALTFTATATDPDLPPNTLTFSLAAGTDPVPAGATISSSGAFSWTPTEAQGPGTYTFKVVVTDNGTPALSDDEEITVTVAEVNIAPTLTDVPATATIPELAPYTFDANATDPDIPPQGLTFSLDGAPAGATIDPATGVFSWTPTEAQGPDSYTFKVKVSDGVVTAESTITITVNEVNAAPVLAPIGNQSVNELSALTFTASATDSDLPPNTLTFSLIGAPEGASINGSSGAFSWTPTEAQGPGSFTFTVRVTDSGSPALFDEETITVTVNEVNLAPQLGAIGNKTVDEETLLSFTATATDADLPPNTLTFSLVAGADPVPAGATIDPTTGVFSWTPTEAQGPETHSFKVRVTDNGSPALFDEEEISVTVNEVNKPPVLGAIGNKSVDELVALNFSATATDPDLPPNTLTFTLIGAPSGAAITAAGAFSWTPTEADGPGTFTFTVKVTDNGSPSLSDEETITVTVNEVNAAPELGAIGSKTVDEETTLTFTATATDSDLPPNTLTFSLVAGTDPVPAGATIDASTGQFSWTPTEAQGPGVYVFKVRVTDSGTPQLFDEEQITVTVNEVNKPPVLAAIGNKTVDEETALTFTATATDPDLPANTLAFSLVGAPASATINPTTGAFSWTPTEADGPGSFTFTVKVTDNGVPAMSDEEQITVAVNEVNKAPTVGTIGPKTVFEGVPLTFTATATDPDHPPNTLTFSLASAPVGATINSSSGAFSWTPPDGPASVSITVRVTDNGSPALSDDEVFTVTVNNANPTATFNAPAGPINEGQTFGISLTSPNDVPADLPTLMYAFDCGSGTYGAPTSTSTKTCPAVDNPGVNVRGKVIDKDGGSTEYTASVAVANAPPVLGPITVLPNAVVPINTTITASAPFTDAGVNDTHTGTYAWDDGTPDSPANITETNGSGTASRSHAYTATGVYVVQLTLRDKDGAEVSAIYQYVVVYDPSAGFVTGGGWINSPAGAYVANPTLIGKANFGFVSKYKKGQSTPDGNTEFQFHAAGMNFKSSAYEWLVVAGAKAQFKGIGTINGSGNYGFMIMAIDGQTNGGGGADKFRIKIWDKNNSDAVVYDNQISASETADPTTLLGGGSIQIHAK